MKTVIEMPVGLVGFADGVDGFGYAFDTRESAVLYADPNTMMGNNYLKQDPDTGYWIWWMDFI